MDVDLDRFFTNVWPLADAERPDPPDPPRSWFVDAWAVRDGAVFASRRRGGGLEGATSTVFLSVPDLEPVPVGRISTALRAAHNGFFQAGFGTADGTEIGFETLADVQELVRRAYLADGLGPTAAARSGAPFPAPGEGSPGVLHLERADQQLELAGARWYDDEAPGEATRYALVRAVDLDRGRVLRLLQAYAEATVLDWEFALDHLEEDDHGGPEAARRRRRGVSGLLDWYAALLACGIWSDGEAWAEFVTALPCPVGARLSRSSAWVDSHLLPWPGEARRRSGADVQAIAPAPTTPGGDRALTRVSDHLLLLQCDVQHPRTHAELVDLMPCLLGAVLTAPEPTSFADVRDTSSVLDGFLAAGLRDLTDEVPSGRLPEEAERMLTDYARRMLELGPEYGPGQPVLA